MSRMWRMSVFDLALGRDPVRLPAPAFRFVYAVSGRIEGRSDDGSGVAEAGSGFLTRGEVELRGPADAWIYEADPSAASPLGRPGLLPVLSRRFELPDDAPRLIRADRIESPAGAQTPRHGHRGPGIRRLLYGRLLAEVGDTVERIEPGQPWFETGRDPVVGTNIALGNSAFVRVMVLPAELHGGKNSFVPTTSDEAAKPRAVASLLFGEVLQQYV